MQFSFYNQNENICHHYQNSAIIQEKFVFQSFHEKQKFEFSRENGILYLEQICQRIGFRFHSKRGFIILKNFFIFLFPDGTTFAPSLTIIKRSNMQEFDHFVRLAELNFPNIFTKEKFQTFCGQ